MQYPALLSTVVLRYFTRDEDGALIAPSALGTVTLVVNDVAQSGSAPTHANTTGIGTISVNTSTNGLLTSGSWATGDRIRAYITGMTVDGVTNIGGWIDDEATIGPLATAASLAAVSTTIGVAGAGLTEAGGTGDQFTGIASVGSVTGAVGSVTGNVGGNVTGSVGSVSGVTFPGNFGTLGINGSGHVSRVTLTDTVTTYTGNTVQTGDVYARLGAPVGASISADIAAVNVLAASAASSSSNAAASAATAATQSTNAATSAASTDTKATTILDRIGSFTTGGVNNILGFLRAIMRSDATTPSDVGGTYDDTTDSLQAIRDRGDAAWITGDADDAGPGPFGVVVNVKSGGVNLQSANVRATNGGETYRLTTDSSGNATYSLPADTWNFYVYKANYLQDDAPLTIVVTADDLTGNNITMTYDPPGQSLTEEDPTMTATFLTMHDVACHLRDMLGGDDSEEKNRLFRRAARMAHDDFFSEDGWKESLVQHRVEVQDSYATGTIAFDLTGGSAERLITLTDGTFPSWAGRGSIVIDSEHYRVVSRLSDTTLQLDETLCPTADIASGTSYTLYQDAYLLPADFGALYSPVDKNGWDRRYVSEEDWLALTTESRIGDDFRYTIMHDDRVPGRYALKFYGYPSEARTLTFLYKRKRKTPVLAGTETATSQGTIAYTNGSATITGSGTAFSDAMIGAVLRIGDATNVPTDAVGDSPYLEEHVIAAVASATSLTLKTAVGLTSGSSKKYRISDPLSFDRGNQLALYKGAEAQYHELVNSSADNVRDARGAYERAKVRARDEQSKHREVGWSPVTGTARTAGRPVINVNPPV